MPGEGIPAIHDRPGGLPDGNGCGPRAQIPGLERPPADPVNP